MPIVNIRMLEGRSAAQKAKMFAAVTDALCATLDCTPDQVRIMIEDIAKTDFAVAGKSVAAHEADKQ